MKPVRIYSATLLFILLLANVALHSQVTLKNITGKWRGETRTIPPGSYVVDVKQPLGILAAYMLEPQSDDGLVTWNFLDAQLKPGGLYPVFKIGGVPPTP